MDKKVYRLYVMRTTVKNMKLAMGERFQRCNSAYTLIYTDGNPPENAVEFTDKDVSRLSKDETTWLLDCNTILVAEEAAKSESKISLDLMQRIKEIEGRLQAQKDIMSETRKEVEQDEE